MSVEEIRKLILKSNVYKSPCLFITHLFKKMDVDHSDTIDYIEFRKGLRYLGVLRNFNETETKSLFARFDRSKNGNISFSDWVITLRPPLSPGRYNVINEAFEKLDTNNDGNLSIEDFENIYAEQAKRHPKYLSKEWTMNEVLRSFLDAFDTPGHCDGIVTKEEFVNYYSIVSATISEDAYFDLLIRSCFGLPRK